MSTTAKPEHAGWLSGRTRLVTAISVIAVGSAGAVAFGANLGILGASADGPVGAVAATDLAPSTSGVAADAAGGDVREYGVEGAGTVSVERTPEGLRLDAVRPTTGWTWTLSQTSPQALRVTLTSGVRSLDLAVVVGADGALVADVVDTTGASAPGAAPSAGTSSDGATDGDDERREHERSEREHEYEGGDDDD